MLYEHVLSIVGQENAPSEQFNMQNITAVEDPELLKPLFLVKYTDELQAKSDVAFLGLYHPHRGHEVALYSCLGKWAGCIPWNAPALVYHHGSGWYDDEYRKEFRPVVLESVILWLRIASGELLRRSL
jgi:hypothetical protein